MASWKLQFYWRLPYPAKGVLASLHARRVDRQRFRSEYHRLKREIAERSNWPGPRFREYQNRRLRELVTQAGRHVPHYRHQFQRLGLDPDGFGDISDLVQLPLLDKQTLREDPSAFLDERQNPERLIRMHTSGTTGTPLTLYRDRHAEAAAFAYNTIRHHGAAGMERRVNRSVSIGGHLVCDTERTRPPFWVENHHWRQLYMSSYHLAPQWLGSYIEKIRTFRPDYLEAYPSSVHAIAHHMVEHGLPPIPLLAVFTTAEKLTDFQRETIESAFQCRVFRQYGLGEQVAFAADCSHGVMHLSPDHSIVEVVDDQGRPLPAGEIGEIVGTNLENGAQPLIRYRTGDLGALSHEPCPCGSPLPVLATLEGRVDAMLILRDGRQIGRLDPVFKGVQGIREGQIVQDDYDRFRIRLVPASAFSPREAEKLQANLAARVGGDARIHVERVSSLEYTRNGKLKAVVRNFDPMRGGSARLKPEATSAW